MGNATMVDTMIKDALWDAFNDYHMIKTADNICDCLLYTSQGFCDGLTDAAGGTGDKSQRCVLYCINVKYPF